MKSQVTLFVLAAILKVLLAFDLHRGHELEVAFLDVGQGDCVLVTTPKKKRILIDGGAGFSGDFQLSKYFPLNNCHLDLMILSHPHADHLGVLNRILDHCKVDGVIFNEVDYDSALYESWLKKLDEGGTEMVAGLSVGEKFVIDGVAFYSVWPTSKKLENGFSNINNSSLVLLLDYRDFEVFLGGDAEVEALDYVFENWAFSPYSGFKLDGKLEVYKAPHHGAENGLHKKK
jgi:competence protein ComEC